MTSPYVTPIGIAIYAIKCKDAVIFSPHPASKKTTNETVRAHAGRAEAARARPKTFFSASKSPAFRWRKS